MVSVEKMIIYRNDEEPTNFCSDFVNVFFFIMEVIMSILPDRSISLFTDVCNIQPICNFYNNSFKLRYQCYLFLKVIDAALKLRKLSNAGEIIEPLIGAVRSLQAALLMRGMLLQLYRTELIPTNRISFFDLLYS